MKYTISSITIGELIQLIDSNKVDLQPPYQRNDIWSSKDQQDLISSIIRGFPLPTFFLYQKTNGQMEMVDGQQRSRTIYRYFSKQIPDKRNLFYSNNNSSLLEYKLSVTYIHDVDDYSDIEQFYVLVNKKGKHLTTPELHKAEYGRTKFMELVEILLLNQQLIDLNLFTQASTKRMNDRNFIEELVSYLLKGIQDKKGVIEHIYEADISEDQKKAIEQEFNAIISKIHILNTIKPISKTRFKQRSDFYTLFNFAHQNSSQKDELFRDQFHSLLLISEHISPSNTDCPPLREYAINCVSQSNSKRSRTDRLNFLNNILLNQHEIIEENEVLAQVFDYLSTHSMFNVTLVASGEYYLIQQL